jgi:methylated-DNA-[protein]-cysteine S-methyltransferase
MEGPSAVATIHAPWGPVGVAVVPAGLVAVSLLADPADFAAMLTRSLGEPAAPAGEADPGLRRLLDRAVDEIEAFLDGRRRAFDVPVVPPGGSAWDRAVLAAVAEVPWGAVTSYGRLAARIGRRGAARAAGGAVGRNSLALVVPCHRVIAGDGSLGGYGGGWFGDRSRLLAIKRELLEREGVSLPALGFWGDVRGMDHRAGSVRG